MRYGLNEKVIKKICDVFTEFAAIEKAVLYGSRAQGTYREGSDLDLTFFGQNLTDRMLGDIADALDDLLLPYTFDLSIFDKLEHAKLRDHIKRVGVTFYQRPASKKSSQNPEPDSGDAVVWETKPLGEVCKITGGGTPSKKNKAFYGGKIPWATVRDMRSDIIRKTEHTITEDAIKASSTNIIPADNVIIATRVGLGKVCFIEQETAINQDLRGIVPNNKQELIGSFLFWWLKSVSHLIIKEGTGATVQGVKLPFVKSLQIPLPPLEEQKRIVAILDEAFRGIDQAIENTEKNLKNARALFETTLNNIFTQKGDGWVEKKLSELTKIKPPKKEAREKLTGNDLVSFVPMKNLGICQKNFTEGENRSLDNVYGGYTYFADGDVLLAKITPCFENGKIGLAQKLTNGVGFGSSEYIVLRPLSEITADYLFYFMSRQSVRDAGTPIMTGAVGHKRVPKEFIENYMVPYPDIPHQKEIAQSLDRVKEQTYRLTATYKQKLTALKELKQSLLQKAFAGELTSVRRGVA